MNLVRHSYSSTILQSSSKKYQFGVMGYNSMHNKEGWETKGRWRSREDLSRKDLWGMDGYSWISHPFRGLSLPWDGSGAPCWAQPSSLSRKQSFSKHDNRFWGSMARVRSKSLVCSRDPEENQFTAEIRVAYVSGCSVLKRTWKPKGIVQSALGKCLWVKLHYRLSARHTWST